jgi:hypothetical protein
MLVMNRRGLRRKGQGRRSCSVPLYTGRLTARLPEAVRLLMFKADGSFLVHDDAGGFRPLNWMIWASAFEADDESELERIGEAAQCLHTRLVLATLDPGDRRVARPHPLGQLLLGQPERHSMLDHRSARFLQY